MTKTIAAATLFLALGLAACTTDHKVTGAGGPSSGGSSNPSVAGPSTP